MTTYPDRIDLPDGRRLDVTVSGPAGGSRWWSILVIAGVAPYGRAGHRAGSPRPGPSTLAQLDRPRRSAVIAGSTWTRILVCDYSPAV
jgi:hypothetical protein